MAAANKNSFSAGPWPMKPKEAEKFRLVTPENRKQAIVYGRILYIIEQIGTHFIFKGTMTADPRFTKGKVKYPFKPWETAKTGLSHFDVYIDEDQNYEKWVQSNKTLIDKFISEKVLYINPSDKILTYTQE
jgi:hypothetical protein